MRSWVGAFNRPEDVAGFLQRWDPECEFFTLFGTRLADAPYKGYSGLSHYLSERAQAWAELHIETADLREVGDRIVMIGRIRGRGLRSGAEIEQRLGLVFELRDNQVLRVRSYSDPDEALEAAGLRQ